MSLDWNKYISMNRDGLADFHCHTEFCDGLDSAEELVKAAIKKGMKVIGFSGHCHTLYDESYCMVGEQVSEYYREIRRIAEKYRNKIEILCGIEQDCLAGMPEDMWDYVIGSVHYIKCGDKYVPVDENREIIEEAVEKHFNGDIYALVEKYYETAADVATITGADIIGHFDIVCKFNSGGEFQSKGALFDEGNPRYINAWKKAVDKAVSAGIPFEINTSLLARGVRQEPYPSEAIREYILEKGGSFILSSDSHKCSMLAFAFDRFRMTAGEGEAS